MTSASLPYVAVPESFKLPPGANFGGTAGVAFNSKGNIFVIHRGPMPLMEFDADGHFIRGFGDGMFDRPHGLRIDINDNIWATFGKAVVLQSVATSGTSTDDKVQWVAGSRSLSVWHHVEPARQQTHHRALLRRRP